MRCWLQPTSNTHIKTCIYMYLSSLSFCEANTQTAHAQAVLQINKLYRQVVLLGSISAVKAFNYRTESCSLTAEQCITGPMSLHFTFILWPHSHLAAQSNFKPRKLMHCDTQHTIYFTCGLRIINRLIMKWTRHCDSLEQVTYVVSVLS